MRGGWRCSGDVELEIGLFFLLWPGAELGWEGSRRVGRADLCIAAGV